MPVAGWLAVAGLGKTLQAIGVMACFREHWPALVVVPAGIKLQVRPALEAGPGRQAGSDGRLLWVGAQGTAGGGGMWVVG